MMKAKSVSVIIGLYLILALASIASAQSNGSSAPGGGRERKWLIGGRKTKRPTTPRPSNTDLCDAVCNVSVPTKPSDVRINHKNQLYCQ